MERKRILENVIPPILGVVVFVAIWAVAAAAVGVSILLPTPIETLSDFFALLGQKTFYVAIGHTLLRTIVGFLIAFLLACIFAFLSKISVYFKKAFYPISVVCRVMPTISIILLVMIWVKSAMAPYLITFLVIFPMLYKTVLDAAENVDQGLLEMTKAYRFSRAKSLFCFYLPEMLPAVLTGIGITLSFSVKLTIAAEVLSFTKDSMGRYMKQASAYVETSTLLAWTLAAILLGFLLEGLLLLIKKLIVRRYHVGK